MQFNLKSKRALVTGASRGIGAAIARAFAEEGVNIALTGSAHLEEAESLAKELRDRFHVHAVAFRLDMADEAAVRGLFPAAEAALGGVLDILVNNAAFCPSGPLDGYTVAEFEKTFRINVTGPFIACQEHIRRLTAAKKSGRIVNIVSQAAFLGSTSGHLPYDASKGALVSMTRALARETGSHGITVNAVAPGLVATEMVAAKLATRKNFYLSRIPLGRIADPSDIANAVVFLASDAAGYLTGTTLDLTGGMLMR